MNIRHVDWYPDEWLSGTFELSVDESGAYITIVSMIYARGGPITMTSNWPRQFKCHGNTLNHCGDRMRSSKA